MSGPGLLAARDRAGAQVPSEDVRLLSSSPEPVERTGARAVGRQASAEAGLSVEVNRIFVPGTVCR